MDARRRGLDRAAEQGGVAARARALMERVRAGQVGLEAVQLAARLDDPTAAALAPCLEAWSVEPWSIEARARTAEALLAGARSVTVGPAPRPAAEPAGGTWLALRDLYHETIADDFHPDHVHTWLAAHPDARLAPPAFAALARIIHDLVRWPHPELPETLNDPR